MSRPGATVMKTMTLNLSETDMAIIEALADKKGLTKTSLVKQALRLYQTVDVRLERGEKVYFEDEQKQKSEIVLL